MGYYGCVWWVTMVWVIWASGNFGCNGRPKFDSGRLLWNMMMFQQNLSPFSSLSLVYGSYKQVAILGAVEDQIWQQSSQWAQIIWVYPDIWVFFSDLHFRHCQTSESFANVSIWSKERSDRTVLPSNKDSGVLTQDINCKQSNYPCSKNNLLRFNSNLSGQMSIR